LKVTILTIGSRGDVQPFVALGVELRDAGHEVTLAAGEGFEAFVSGRGLRFAALDVEFLERLQSSEGKAALSGRNFLGTLKQTASMYRRVLDQELEASRGAEAVVYHPKALGGYHISEALNVPGFLAHPIPMFSPTRAFPNPVLPVADLGGPLNRSSYGAFLRLSTAPFHRTINRWREETLGLPPRRLLASELELRGEPVRKLIGCSPHVVPPPADWDRSTTMTGYWFLDGAGDWRPPAHLVDFLEDGPPPVYVGFGSLGRWTSDEVVGTALSALRRSGKRVVLAKGGGRVRPDLPGDVCVIEAAPHEWLFPRMAAVVHHGGAGTTAEGLRAGRPTVICPTTMNDQLFWGRRVSELGVGPEPIPQKKLMAETLLPAIRTATGDERVAERAAVLGEKIRTERGVARAVEVIGASAP
jgi:sterol 3beta-glucosyltransferase